MDYPESTPPCTEENAGPGRGKYFPGPHRAGIVEITGKRDLIHNVHVWCPFNMVKNPEHAVGW